MMTMVAAVVGLEEVDDGKKETQPYQLLALMSAPDATSNLHTRRWPLEAAQMSAVFWLNNTDECSKKANTGERVRWNEAGDNCMRDKTVAGDKRSASDTAVQAQAAELTSCLSH